MIKCDCCNRKFEAILDGTGLGYKCSSSVSHKGVQGHYGSVKHDCSVYKWTEPKIRDMLILEDEIKQFCDDCISELVAVGALSLFLQGVP